MSNIVKLCANHLCTLSNNYGVKLKSSHAHELVAAFFGYKSKAAMLADTSFPAEHINQAQILVLTPSLLINERRQCLDDLPLGLRDTYTLGEEMFVYLASGGKYIGRSFASWIHLFEVLAYDYLIKNSASVLSSSFWHNEKVNNIFSKPLYEYKLDIENTSNSIKLTGTNRYCSTSNINFRYIDLAITIKLQRISGYVGYANPEITVTNITSPLSNELEGI